MAVTLKQRMGGNQIEFIQRTLIMYRLDWGNGIGDQYNNLDCKLQWPVLEWYQQLWWEVLKFEK